MVLRDGKPIPRNTPIVLMREGTIDSMSVPIASDGRFVLRGVPRDEQLRLSLRLPGYRYEDEGARLRRPEQLDSPLPEDEVVVALEPETSG